MANEVGRKSVVEAAKAEIKKEAIKEATTKLTDLYRQEKQAKKVLKNIQREIKDYVHELELDEEDD